MPNIKLILEYDGTDFHGFQRQRGLRTVQGVLEERFSKLLGEKIKIVGAGRTDAGVHARGQVVNFHTTRPVGLDRLGGVLNAALPDDVKVQTWAEAEAAFHARRCARSRTYRYVIVERAAPSPIAGRFALVVADRLDLAAMKEAAVPLVGRHDFRAFQAAGSETKTTERNLICLECRRTDAGIEILAEADSFLYRMMRNIVSGLIEVGRGGMKSDALGRAMARGERLPGCSPAPACGLCLVQVSY